MDQPGFDRRQHERYAATGGARLSWRGRAVTGGVTNVSTEGMAVLVPEPIALGQLVRVKMDRTSYQGCIRACRVQGAGCLVGVQIAMLNKDEESPRVPDVRLKGN